MKNFKAIYFFALLAFMVLGCEEETPEIYQESSSIVKDDIKLSFNLDNFDDPVGAVKGNVEVLWEEYSTQTIDGQEWQEYKIKELRPRMYSQDSTATYIGREKGYNYTLLATKVNGRPEFYLAKIVSYSHLEERSFFFLEENNFHGLLYLYNMTGVPTYIMHYEKGEVLNKIENLEVAQEIKNLSNTLATARCMEKGSTIAKCDSALSCAFEVAGGGSSGGSCGGGGSSGGSGWVAVTTYHYTDWYNMRPSGAQYSHTQYNGSTTEWVWRAGATTAPPVRGSWNYATEQSYGGVSYSGSRPRNAIINTLPIVFDSSVKRNPCVTAIMKGLSKKDTHLSMVPDINNMQGVSHLSQTILNLFNSDAKYNLVFKVGEAGYGKNAHTVGKTINGVLTVTITLDEDYVKRGTQLALARTLIHESMHAYLKYVTRKYSNSEVSDVLNTYYNNHMQNENIAHHIFMSEYVDAIASSLAAWDGHKLSSSYYNDLAWSGDMQNTEAFNKLPKSKQESIKKANKAEGDAINNATDQARSPKCN